MMKKLGLIVSLAVVCTVISCKKNESKNEVSKNDIVKTEKFVVDSVKISDSLKVNDKLTLGYESKTLVFPGIKNKMLLDSIYFDKKGITDYSAAGLKTFLENDKTEYYNSFRKESADLDFVQYPQKWYSGSAMKIISNANDYLQIEYFYDSYEGGAHGNYSFTDRVYDLKLNKKLDLKDITTMPDKRLSDLLMKNLNKVPSGTTDSQGAVNNSDMLLVEVIPANRSFYFDDKNLYFHYSPYEIAAYAAGDIIIPVSWDDLKGTLNEDFKTRMKIK